MTFTTSQKGVVTGYILQGTDSPWMYYSVVIRCPDNSAISIPYTINDKSDLPAKGTELPLRKSAFGYVPA